MMGKKGVTALLVAVGAVGLVGGQVANGAISLPKLTVYEDGSVVRTFVLDSYRDVRATPTLSRRYIIDRSEVITRRRDGKWLVRQSGCLRGALCSKGLQK